MAFYHCYRPHRFNASTTETLDRANHIIDDLRGQGYTLTLRQLYYQFVRRNWLANEEKEYKRLGSIVTRAREAGLMDWFAIEDRGRNTHSVYCNEDRGTAVKGIEYNLNLDQWARQDHYLEVWVEKQALEGIISGPCDKLDVTYMACKGYLSASEAWRAGMRFKDATLRGKKPVLIHLADHDPSGLNMTDDNRLRLRMFAEDQGVEVRRIALTMEQIDEHDPPPNPANLDDSRAKAYVREYGPSSWELDALEPATLDDLITDTIEEYRDRKVWEETLEEETEVRKPLVALSDNWERVEEFLHDEGLV